MAENNIRSATRFIKKNPELAALGSKLIKDKIRPVDSTDRNDVLYNTNQSTLNLISKSIGEGAADFENIVSLFPDIELSIQILISSIISPKDMTGDEIIYRVKESFLAPEITSELIEIIKVEMENFYGLGDNLYDLLKEVLFVSGSYANAIIPESEVDRLINSPNSIVSSESLIKINLIDKEHNLTGMGFLGNQNVDNKKFAFESINAVKDFSFTPKVTEEKIQDLLINITDNFDVLKIPKAMRTNVSKSSESIVDNFYKKDKNTESRNQLNKIKDAFYKNTASGQDTLQLVGTGDNYRESIGRPLILKLPSESIIPVHTPGNPDEHLGYFIILDENGNPVNMAGGYDKMYSDMSVDINQQSNSMVSFLNKKVKNSIEGRSYKGIDLDNYTALYGSLVENELLSRLKNGIFGDNVAISNVSQVYQIMLSRAFKNRMTRILFMPEKVVSYITYNKYPNGVGKSLTDNLKILTSLRAMMLFSRLMASVKNSIGITEVKLKLDERDPDPTKTIEVAMHEIIKTRQQNFPLGISTPMDLVDWVQRAGFQFSFSGHPKLPDMEMEFEQRGSTNIMPDQDLDEDLRKRTIQAMGLSPENVDAGFNAEFATTIVQNNVLLSRRVKQIQKKIVLQIKEYIVKVCNYDGVIQDKLKKAIKENFKNIKKYIEDNSNKKIEVSDIELIEYVMEEFLENIIIELPKPDNVNIENQLESFNKYKEFLETAIDSWISSEVFTEQMSGELSGKIEDIKASVKSRYLRKYLADNNILGELVNIGDIPEEGKFDTVFGEQKDYLIKMTKKLMDFVKDVNQLQNAVNSDLQDAGITDDGMSSSSSYDESSSSEEGGDEFGDDEFSMDDDAANGEEGAGEETETTEETTETTEETTGEGNDDETKDESKDKTE